MNKMSVISYNVNDLKRVGACRPGLRRFKKHYSWFDFAKSKRITLREIIDAGYNNDSDIIWVLNRIIGKLSCQDLARLMNAIEKKIEPSYKKKTRDRFWRLYNESLNAHYTQSITRSMYHAIWGIMVANAYALNILLDTLANIKFPVRTIEKLRGV